VRPLRARKRPPGRDRAEGRRFPRLAVIVAGAFLLLSAAVFAEGRTVEGRIVRVDPGSRSLSVKDSRGTVWNYSVDRDAGVDLPGLRPGVRVSVSIRRATPLNMSSPADRIRKGDRVVALPQGGRREPAAPPTHR
jgi:hypothetical protein